MLDKKSDEGIFFFGQLDWSGRNLKVSWWRIYHLGIFGGLY